MKNKLILIFIVLFSVSNVMASTPRLIVNIVMGSMRAEDLERYAENFTQGGLRRLMDGGCTFANSRYDYQQTTTPVALATLSTGAMPSTHGVVGAHWVDYTTNKTVGLIQGSDEALSPNLIAPTLAETLIRHKQGSRAVTIATDPLSAMVFSGRSGGECYWLNERSLWATSSLYCAELPDWIRHINRENYNRSYTAHPWRTLLDQNRYQNTLHYDIELSGKRSKKKEQDKPTARLKLESDYDRLCYTPAGNTALFGFAKQAIAQCQLGQDPQTDLLNICLDPARYINEAYGAESVETEDMYYCLDRDLADFLTFVFAQVKNQEVVVVFTASHGISPSYEDPKVQNRFNSRQFEVIVNGFLNVRYGTGEWVIACQNKSLWLNHNLIYERGLNLEEVQNEVAIFAMQFSGVSHALAASAMRASYFGSGYARKLQNSFYPRRSGDVILNLMPGWIEDSPRCVAKSGSMYGYDTHVPLIFYGHGIAQMRIGHKVDLTSIAPTLAHIAGITEPAASEGEVLSEIIDL